MFSYKTRMRVGILLIILYIIALFGYAIDKGCILNG